MGFKILNLDTVLFAEKCQELETLVRESAFEPDLVIAIPRSGLRMLPYVFPDKPQNNVVLPPRKKDGIKKYIMQYIAKSPQWFKDLLRIVHAKWLVSRRNRIDIDAIGLPEPEADFKRILIIDDAVDSGATMLAVVESFKKKYPEIELRTAVLTVTGRKPAFIPDYSLYNNSTLIRTPWSPDSL